MFNDASRLFCNTIYINENDEGFMYAAAHAVQNAEADIRLSFSPFSRQNNHGVSLVADYAAKYAGKFPHDTTIRAQIGILDDETKLNESSYSFFALCLLLGGFWIHTGERHVEDFKARQKARIRKQKLSKLDPASRRAAEDVERTWREIQEHQKSLEGGAWF
jgi:hypothetical protein